MPAHDLRTWGVGKQSAFATAVAATARRMGLTEASITPVPTHEMEEELGSLSPAARGQMVAQSAKGKIAGRLSYEDGPYAGHGMFGSVSPTGSDPYSYAYSAPAAAAYVPQLWSVELGIQADSNTHYGLTGAIQDGFKLIIEAEKLWMFEETYLGQKVTNPTMAVLAARTVESIRSADTALTIDAVGGTIGTTGVPATLIKSEFEVKPKVHLKPFVGSLYPEAYGIARWEASLKMILEFGATARGLANNIIAGTKQELQVRHKAMSGTKVAQVDFAGLVMGGEQIWEDRDGNMTLAVEISPKDNAALGNWMKMLFTNSNATLV